MSSEQDAQWAPVRIQSFNYTQRAPPHTNRNKDVIFSVGVPGAQYISLESPN